MSAPHVITPTRLEIEDLWHQGLTVRAIAAEMCLTANAVSKQIRTMRKAPETWNLPRRWEPYPPRKLRHSSPSPRPQWRRIAEGLRDDTYLYREGQPEHPLLNPRYRALADGVWAKTAAG